MKFNIKSDKYTFVYFVLAFLVLFLLFLLFSFGRKTYSAKVPLEDACTKEAVVEMSKILYKEYGGDLAVNPDENFYARIATAAVILNNANVNSDYYTKGETMADRIHNLSDSKYYKHSEYKDKSFDEVVIANKNQIIYISELVLTGKFNFPSNMIFQAADYIVDKWGHRWDAVMTIGNFDDMHFGYENSLNNTDIWGRTVSDTSKEYFRNLANSFKLDDYSFYTLNNVCQNSNNTTTPKPETKEKYKVTFYTSINSESVYHSEDVESGNYVTAPQAPTLDGFSCKEWRDASGNSFNFNTPITENLSLYAHWEEIPPVEDDIPTPEPETKEKYKVTFYTSINSGSVYHSEDVESGNYVAAPQAPTSDGFSFKGWHDVSGNSFNFNTPITKNLSLYAHWEEIPPVEDDVPVEDNESNNDSLENVEKNPGTNDSFYYVLFITMFMSILSLYFYNIRNYNNIKKMD